MSGEEIRERIIANNIKISELVDPTTFVLSPEIASLIKENQDLRKQCVHVYENGRCIFCQEEEPIP